VDYSREMNKQFILSLTYFVFLTVQIITITFLEGLALASASIRFRTTLSLVSIPQIQNPALLSP